VDRGRVEDTRYLYELGYLVLAPILHLQEPRVIDEDRKKGARHFEDRYVFGGKAFPLPSLATSMIPMTPPCAFTGT